MLVSVIVPTYRRPEYLKRCIKALADQMRKPNEVVVVVRDADEESQKVVAELQTFYSSTFALREAIVSEPGQMPAMNAGLNKARGEIICFTDDDAEPYPDWVERIENHFQSSAIAGVGGQDVVMVNGKPIKGKCKVVGRMRCFGRYVGNHHLELESEKPIKVDLLKGANMSFLATYLENFRFDEYLDRQASSQNELDLCLTIKKKRGKIIYDPNVKVIHHAAPRGWGGRGDIAKNIYDYSRNYTYVILKHFPWYRKIFFLAYFFLIGQRSSWGLLTLLVDPLIECRITWRRQVLPSFKGKIDGLKTYLRWVRQHKPDKSTQKDRKEVFS